MRGDGLQRYKLKEFRGPSQKKRWCSACVGCATATSWWVVSVISPLQALKSSEGVMVMSLVARSNMRWVQGPLWDILFGSAASALLSVCIHAHTHTGRGRQKSPTQNKGIIIPHREKWSLHFPARFRSLIETRHNGWHLGKGVVYSKRDTFLPIALCCFFVCVCDCFPPCFLLSDSYCGNQLAAGD